LGNETNFYRENIETAFFTERLMRISRYFDMLTTSFSIMEDGMEVDQYMKFRNTLTLRAVFKAPVSIN
jgi:tryptophan 2,3-dioxygenase